MVCCCGESDCRHKSKECAAGFVCEEEGGEWDCVKAVEVVTDDRDSVKADKAGSKVSKAAARQPGPDLPAGNQAVDRPCKGHRSCSDKAVECVCNDAGQLVLQILDKDGDGSLDEKAKYRYDPDGQMSSVMVDVDMDGTDDVRHDYGYNSSGVPAFWEIRKLPGGEDKKPDSRLTYHYDAGGLLVEEIIDVGLDGTPDEKCVYDPPCPPPFPNHSCKRTCVGL